MAEELKQTEAERKQTIEITAFLTFIWSKIIKEAGIVSLLCGLITTFVIIGVGIERVISQLDTVVKVQNEDHSSLQRVCFRLQIPCAPDAPFIAPPAAEPSTAVAPIPPMPRPHSRNDNPFAGTSFAKSTHPPEDTVIPQEFERKIR